MSNELTTEVKEHWSDQLRTDILALVGTSNKPKEISKPSERKAMVSVRTKMTKLIKAIDEARKASNREVQEANKITAEELTALIEPTKLEYDKLIDQYDEELRLKQEAEAAEKLAAEKEVLDGRLSQLEGIITTEELQFIDIANMPDAQFEAFVAYRKSITITPVATESKIVNDEPAEETVDTVEETVEHEPTKETAPEPVNDVEVVTLDMLTDDDELGAFCLFRSLLGKLKKPAIIKSATAMHVREMIDNLTEVLDQIIPDEEK